MESDRTVIDYLSQEIETHTNILATYRTRANFPLFIGPFLVLSSILIAYKGVPNSITMDRWIWLAGVGLVISYVATAVVAARTEILIWRQCNKWRSLIARLTRGEVISEKDLEFKDSLARGYTVAYGAMMLAFICTLKIVSGLAAGAIPN